MLASPATHDQHGATHPGTFSHGAVAAAALLSYPFLSGPDRHRVQLIAVIAAAPTVSILYAHPAASA